MKFLIIGLGWYCIYLAIKDTCKYISKGAKYISEKIKDE